jgi:hypothetical protein
MYDTSNDHIFDHIIRIETDESDTWSVGTGSTSDSSLGGNARLRSDSQLSTDSTDFPFGDSMLPASPSRAGKARAGSNLETVDEAAADLASLAFTPGGEEEGGCGGGGGAGAGAAAAGAAK